MTRLELWQPVSPFHINQDFGGNPDYYSRFHDQFGNSLKGHMGTDLMAVHGQPVYAAIEGKASYTKDSHGGEGVIIQSKDAWEYDGGTCWFNVINWHLIGDTDPKFPKPFEVKDVKVGDLIGYADNTGAPFESSGDHLHVGLVPVDVNGKPLLSANGFNGNIDAMPYMNNYFAPNADKVLNILQSIVDLLKNFIAGK